MRKRQANKIRRLIGVCRYRESQIKQAAKTLRWWEANLPIDVAISMALQARKDEKAGREPWSVEKFFLIFNVRKKTKERVRRVFAQLGIDPAKGLGLDKCLQVIVWCGARGHARENSVDSKS